MCVLALLLATPVWADEPPQDPNDWACDTPSAPLYPRNFIGELYDELLKGHPFSDEENALYRDGQAHNALDRLQLRDDFQQRWLEWLAGRGLPSDWKCGDPRDGGILGAAQIPAVNLDTEIISAEAAAVGTGIQSNVQHSIAKNIPKKKFVRVRVYGDSNCTKSCVTLVSLLWNGVAPGILKNPLKLLPYPGTLVSLNLQPSDILAANTNQLQFTLVQGTNVPKVFVKAENLTEFFPGSQFLKTNNFYDLPFNKPTIVNVALGLACTDPLLYPRSAQHILDAQKLGFARIVSPKRRGLNVGTPKKRSTSNTDWYRRQKPTPVIPVDYDVDEYPQALFSENQIASFNAGRPHMRPIPKSDNRGSGSKVGSYATPYEDGEQLEVIVPDQKLFCRNAF